eukprot:CAMPEP_0203757166 /NCGR_PEP_ID=MMETSP0098-20131031/10307_1 /ASSEMBLY_ACC=CAM_ASM_000208 /TAXON_ID=96639 /ORGANISM=" , Strain NY0313808BC1" /LENGTH=2141 /DNA_ID=CAMNT_0050649309 /DNA_START=380 /DNA_END=6802 /DNA_ORIENTATION=+
MRRRASKIRHGGDSIQSSLPSELSSEYTAFLAEKLLMKETPDLIVRGFNHAQKEQTARDDVRYEEQDTRYPIFLVMRDFRRIWEGYDQHLEPETLGWIGRLRSHVDLTPWQADYNLMEVIGKTHPELKVMNADGCAMLDSRGIVSCVTNMKRLSGGRHLKLKHLDLSNWKARNGVEEINTGVAVVATCCGSSLESLELRNTGVTDKALYVLANRCPNLRLLDVSTCPGVTDDGVAILLQTPPPRENIANPETDEGFVCSGNRMRTLLVDKCVNIRARWFLAPGITKDSQVTIVNSLLTHVDLTGCTLVVDEAIRELCISINENLKSLRLGDCGLLTDAAMKPIGSLCTNLQVLSCTGCVNLTDDGIIFLTTGVIKNMEIIDVSATRVTDVGLSALCEAFSSSLQVLNARAPQPRIEANLMLQKQRVVYSLPEQKSTLTKRVLREGMMRRRGSWIMPVDDDGARSNNVPRLQVLDISEHCLVDPFRIAALCSHSSDNLFELNISGCELIDDPTIETVAMHCPRLTLLNVAGCHRLGNNSLNHIACAVWPLRFLDISLTQHDTDDKIDNNALLVLLSRKRRTLRKLAVRYRQHFSCDGLRTFAAHEQHGFREGSQVNVLSELDAEGCLGLEESGLGELLELFPFLEIVRLSMCPQIRNESLAQILNRYTHLEGIRITESPWFGLKAHPCCSEVRNARKLAQERFDQETRAAVKLQRRFRAFLAAPPTLEYILRTEGEVLNKYAIVIQRKWRARCVRQKFLKIKLQTGACCVIQRAFRAFLWRRCISSFVNDVELKRQREEIAAQMKLEYHSSQCVQQWYRKQLWERSEEGLFYQQLRIEAATELNWRKKTKRWKSWYDEVTRQAARDARGQLRFRAACVYALPSGKKLRRPQLVSEKQARAIAHADILMSGARSKRVCSVEEYTKMERRDYKTRGVISACKECGLRKATTWCAMCREVLCSECVWNEAKHEIHIFYQNKNGNCFRKITDSVHLSHAQEEEPLDILYPLLSANDSVKDFRYALGPSRVMTLLRKQMMKELEAVLLARNAAKRRSQVNARLAQHYDLEIAAQMVQRVFRKNGEARKKKILKRTKRKEEIELAAHIHKCASKIQAFTRGLRPRKLWVKIRGGFYKLDLGERRELVATSYRNLFFEVITRSAENRMRDVESLYSQYETAYTENRSFGKAKHAKLVTLIAALSQKHAELQDELDAHAKSTSNTQAAFRARVLGVEAHFHEVALIHLRQVVSEISKRIGEREADREGRLKAIHDTSLTKMVWCLKHVDSLVRIRTWLQDRCSELEDAVQSSDPLKLKQAFEKSASSEMRRLCLSGDRSKMLEAAECELQWNKSKLKANETDQSKVESPTISPTTERSSEGDDEEISERVTDEKDEQGDTKEEIDDDERDDEGNESDGEEDVEQGLIDLKPEPTRKRSMFVENIPDELNKYYIETYDVADYEVKRLIELMAFENKNRSQIVSILGISNTYMSTLGEIRRNMLRKNYKKTLDNSEVKAENNEVLKIMNHEERLRSTLAKLNARFVDLIAKHSSNVAKFDGTLQLFSKLAIDKKTLAKFYRGFLPESCHKSHVLSVKRLRREIRYGVWAAGLPPRFFCSSERIEETNQLMERVREMREMGEQAKLEEIEEEKRLQEQDDMDLELLDGAQGELAADLVGELKQNKGKRLTLRSLVLDASEGVKDWLFQARKLEEQRIEKSILNRQQKITSVFECLSGNVAMTFGMEETNDKTKAEDLKRKERLSYMSRLTQNIGPHDAVYLWYSTTYEPSMMITDIVLSHAATFHELHIATKPGYKKILHPEMDGCAKYPALEILVETLGTRKHELHADDEDGLRCAKEIRLSYLPQHDEEFKGDGFERLDYNLGEFGLVRDVYFWVKWIYPLDDVVEAISRGKKPSKGGDHIDIKLLNRKLESLQQQLASEEERKSESAKNTKAVIAEIEGMIEQAEAEKSRVKDEMLANATEYLALSKKEFKTLVSRFAEMDADKSGEITVDELCSFIKVPLTPLIENLFAFLDSNSDGSVDFPEFIHVLSTFCMFDGKQMASVCHQLMDPDDDGLVLIPKINRFFETAHDVDPQEIPQLRGALSYLESVANEGKITVDDILQMNARYPFALFPAMQIRDKMRQKFFGKKW